MTLRLGRRDAGLIAGLIYPVIFEEDPLDGVDRALEIVAGRRAMGAEPVQYLAAIRAALASGTQLASLLPQPHPEPVIRSYLTEIERRLAEK